MYVSRLFRVANTGVPPVSGWVELAEIRVPSDGLEFGKMSAPLSQLLRSLQREDT
jgi:hypothetical protein